MLLQINGGWVCVVQESENKVSCAAEEPQDWTSRQTNPLWYYCQNAFIYYLFLGTWRLERRRNKALVLMYVTLVKITVTHALEKNLNFLYRLARMTCDSFCLSMN